MGVPVPVNQTSSESAGLPRASIWLGLISEALTNGGSFRKPDRSVFGESLPEFTLVSSTISPPFVNLSMFLMHGKWQIGLGNARVHHSSSRYTRLPSWSADFSAATMIFVASSRYSSGSGDLPERTAWMNSMTVRICPSSRCGLVTSASR